MHLDAPLLVGLALRERYVIDMLVDAHQRKTQIRFTGVALGVARDESTPYPIAEKRTCARIDHRRPYHESRNRIVPVANMENEIVGKTPEHAGERQEQYRRLKQSDDEIGRKLAELARVFMDALIRIDPHRSS